MRTQQAQEWITGEDANRERLRLIEAGVPDDAPEFRHLHARIRARDDYLYERYGKPLLQKHYGKWIAIATDGRVIISSTSGELGWEADREFGAGEYSKRKLAEFPGHEILY